jgi:hypothetical protein
LAADEQRLLINKTVLGRAAMHFIQGSSRVLRVSLAGSGFWIVKKTTPSITGYIQVL